MRLHGSCAALDDDAVLLLGPSGAGKSDLLLRLIDRGFSLVGDDQVEWDGERISPVAPLAGLIEVRGLGLFTAPHRPSARLCLIVALGDAADRLPQPLIDAQFGVPRIALDPAAVSAAIRVHWALDASRGALDASRGALDASRGTLDAARSRVANVCGAFAA